MPIRVTTSDRGDGLWAQVEYDGGMDATVDDKIAVIAKRHGGAVAGSGCMLDGPRTRDIDVGPFTADSAVQFCTDVRGIALTALMSPREIARQAAQDLVAIGNAIPRWESELTNQIGAIVTARRMVDAAGGADGILPDALKRLHERAAYYHYALDELLDAMEGTD